MTLSVRIKNVLNTSKFGLFYFYNYQLDSVRKIDYTNKNSHLKYYNIISIS